MKNLFLGLCIVFLTTSIRSQILVPNIPNVILDTIANTAGYITGFEHDSSTHKLYIAGEFTRVGNVNRQGLAVIDMNTGAVLNDLSFITLSDLSAINHVDAHLKLFNNRLYIGGAFVSPSGDFLLSVNLTSANVRGLYTVTPLSDFEIYNSKVYTTGAYYGAAPQQFDVSEMDTLGNITWKKSIVNTTSERLNCLDVKNNMLFVGGEFSSFGGVSVNNVAKVDLTTHTITTWKAIPAPGPAGNVNCFSVQDLTIYPNDILLNLQPSSCGNPAKNVAGYNTSTGSLNNQIATVTYNNGASFLAAENDTMFWYFNPTGLKLRGFKNYVASWSPTANSPVQPYSRKAGYLFIGGGFSTLQGANHKGLGVYCVAPAKPQLVTLTSKVCRGQTNFVFNVAAVKDASNYIWSYTGTGVTITGTSPSVLLNFSLSATSGTLRVYAQSYCGTTGDTLKVPFTVYPLPNVNAGPDVIFTCAHNIDSLKGSSSTTGTAFSWTGPSYSSSSAINQITNAASGGNYILTVTEPVSGCKDRDTAQVIFDTMRPSINHNLIYGQLNCTNSIVTIDASGLYNVNDNLHWSGNSFSQNNPANITVAGIYTLTITSGNNACVNKDTFNIKSDLAPPTISAPAALDTITCSRDSVQLPAGTSSSNTVLYWRNSLNDSLLNNSYTLVAGTYVAHALDTSNGCTSQLIRVVNQYTTPPGVQVPAGIFSVNCSFGNVLLNGSSSAGTQLSWSGPNGFSSTDPASTQQAGTYVLTALNPQNGCTSKDSVQVLLQNILILSSSSDTTICNGSSATLSSAPIGGTPGFTYQWSGAAGAASTTTVSPALTTNYVITIADNAGCIGKDTITVLVPPAVSDSVNTFQPCDPNNPNGQIQAYGVGGIAPYQYEINNGSFQSSGIFTGLNYGTYSVTVKDSLGCAHNFSATINQSSTLPTPDFILSTTQIKGDTFVLVDISNPRPDSLHWILPSTCSIINSDLFAPMIVNADTGAMQITMIAWFGTCQMQLTKNVVVILPDTNFATNNNNNGIATLVLYPNPNTGQFTVDVTFYKKQSFAIFIFDAIGNEILRLPFANTDSASAAINLNNPAPGTYILKVIAEYDSRTRSFLINQH